MLPGGLTLEPGEALVRTSELRWIDPPIVPAAPFTESHVIVTNRRVILLGEKHHEYKVFSIKLSSINRVDIKDFPGAGLVRMIAGSIAVVEYWEDNKIKILRLGSKDAEVIVKSIEEAKRGETIPSPTVPPPVEPELEPAEHIYCTTCGTKLEVGTKFCTNCGKRVELP